MENKSRALRFTLLLIALCAQPIFAESSCPSDGKLKQAAQSLWHDSDRQASDGQDFRANYRVCSDYKDCFEQQCKMGPKYQTPDHMEVVSLQTQREFREASRPFVMCSQQKPSKGTVVLVHGYTDSPFTFGKLAEQYAKDGYNVVAPLLSGHGQDMTYPDVNSCKTRMNRTAWLNDVDSSVKLARRLFPNDNLNLGGFSTGGALVVDYTAHLPAAEQTKINSLVLFDPAVKLPNYSTNLLQKIFNTSPQKGFDMYNGVPQNDKTWAQTLGDTWTDVGLQAQKVADTTSIMSNTRGANFLNPARVPADSLCGAGLEDTIRDLQNGTKGTLKVPTVAFFTTGESTPGKQLLDPNAKDVLFGKDGKGGGVLSNDEPVKLFVDYGKNFSKNFSTAPNGPGSCNKARNLMHTDAPEPMFAAGEMGNCTPTGRNAADVGNPCFDDDVQLAESVMGANGASGSKTGIAPQAGQ